jgi:GNAT superfamily N-acetyltransferase
LGTIEKVKHDRATLNAYVELFKSSYGDGSKFTVDYLDWLYAKNPAGPVLGFDYVDGQHGIVAHYACIPAPIAIHGRNVKAVLALNTATHPDFQGQGLFTKLAGMAFAGAGDAGFEYAYGVPNAAATPGLTGKQGFSLICSLDARICFSGYRRPAGAPVSAPGFQRTWTTGELAWRLSDPLARWRTKLGGDNVLRVWGPGPAPFIPTYEEIVLDEDLRSLDTRFPMPGSMAFGPRLHLGIRPPLGPSPTPSVSIPRRLWPSPLNFVVKNLQGETPKISPDEVVFTALDFDAY